MAKYDDLLKQANELGVPTNSGVYKPMSEAYAEIQITEYELHRRVQEELRHRREHDLWRIAVASMVAAFIAAIGAWLPLLPLLLNK